MDVCGYNCSYGIMLMCRNAHGLIWNCMFVWMCNDLYGCIQISMDLRLVAKLPYLYGRITCGIIWCFTNVHRFINTLFMEVMELHGLVCTCIDSRGCIYTDMYASDVALYVCMDLHRFAWMYKGLWGFRCQYGVVLICMGAHASVWICITHRQM